MPDRSWRNWAGGVACTPASYRAPESEAAIADLLAGLEGDRTVRVAGSGHSFPPLVPSDDVLVSLENHTGVVDVDADAGRVTVRAGTVLRDLTRTLAEHGLALRNLGDVDAQTVAGALATGTHGTGADLGVLATQVESMRLVTADGTVRDLAPDTDPDLFRAAQVSLGALGVVSTVTLDVVPAYDLELRTRAMPLAECLAALDDLRDRHRHVEFFWFPGTDTAYLKTMDRTDAPRTGTGGDFDSTLENVAWEAMCRLSTHVPRSAGLVSRLAAWSVSERHAVGPSHELFAHQRDVRFEESEYGVPAADGPAAIREIRDWLAQSDEPVVFPVEFRYVAGDDVPLSPAYGRDSAFLAVHTYHRKPHAHYFDAAADVFARYDGRPHWGKRHTLTARDLAPRYPEWDLFQDVRRSLDPDGLFLNDHLERLFVE